MASATVLRQQREGDAGGQLGRGGKVRTGVGTGSDRRDPPQGSLPRGRDRARIKGVLPEVHPVVDAGNDEIGLAWKHAPTGMDRHIDAVGRGSVESKDPGFDASQPKRAVKVERMARSALLGLGRQKDYVRLRRERRPHRPDACARVSVVVRQEDQRAHGDGLSQKGRRPRCRANVSLREDT